MQHVGSAQGAGYLDQDQAVVDDKVGSALSCVMRVIIHISNLGAVRHHSTILLECLLVVAICSAVRLG